MLTNEQPKQLSEDKLMRVIVCGGRDYDDFETVCATLDKHPIRHLWHGNARGADTLADRWARAQQNVSVHPVPAQWKKHGKAAGPIRNQAMLGQSPDLVIAFAGGRGTSDMVKRARKAGIPVQEVSPTKDTDQ